MAGRKLKTLSMGPTMLSKFVTSVNVLPNVFLSLHNFREWMKYFMLLQSSFQVLPLGEWEGRDSGHLLHWLGSLEVGFEVSIERQGEVVQMSNG